MQIKLLRQLALAYLTANILSMWPDCYVNFMIRNFAKVFY